MIHVAMTSFPLAAELPVPDLPMSPLMRAIVHLRLSGFGYKRIARELRISRERARDYAQAADLGGVRGCMPPRRTRPATVRATSCARCGRAIAIRKGGRPARFCSRRCRDATNCTTRKARRKAARDRSRGVGGTAGPNGSAGSERDELASAPPRSPGGG